MFDCDSTLSRIEGIDELARAKGVHEQVERITRAAMEGNLNFFEALSTRLTLICPGRKELIDIGHRYTESITEDTAEVVRVLIASGVRIFVVSGGFLDSIIPLTDYLNIARQNVFANQIIFDHNQAYAGFDDTLPAARASGKREITARLPGRKVFVGDGASDLQAKPVVELFIGYCGVHARHRVMAEADYIIETESMAPLLTAVFPKQAPVQAGGDVVPLWEDGKKYWLEQGKRLPLESRKIEHNPSNPGIHSKGDPYGK